MPFIYGAVASRDHVVHNTCYFIVMENWVWMKMYVSHVVFTWYIDGICVQTD